MKKPLLNRLAVTMPRTATIWPTSGDSSSALCTSCGQTTGGGVQPFSGDALLRGVGGDAVLKSAPLMLVSTHPACARTAETFAARAGAAALPSEQFAAP